MVTLCQFLSFGGGLTSGIGKKEVILLLFYPALTIKKIKISHFWKKCEIIELTQKLFFRKPQRKEVFIKKTKEKIPRAEARKHLAQFHLSCELLKVIRRFFRICCPCWSRSRIRRTRGISLTRARSCWWQGFFPLYFTSAACGKQVKNSIQKQQ